MRRTASFTVLVLVLCSAALAADVPMAVSPGSPTGALVESRCPTFSWGEVEGARSYELVVYRLGKGEEAKPILRHTFAGPVNSWTPSLDRCLERGDQYAWSVRAEGRNSPGAWSEARLFEIAVGPSVVEVEQALATLRSYLAAERTEGPPPSAVPAALEPHGSFGKPAPEVHPAGSAAPAPQMPFLGTAKLRVEAAAELALIVHGIRGITEDENHQSAGVLGEAINADMSAGSRGVMGRSNAFSGAGVEGFADGVAGEGVRGTANGASGTGGLFVGSGSAQALVASASPCCDGNQPADYSVALHNFSSGDDPDVLALQVNHSANTRVNYISFFDRTISGMLRKLGEIQADGNGGIHYKGSHLTLSATDTPLSCNQVNHTGRIYFDNSRHEPCFCNGTSWQQMDGGGAC